MFLLDVQPDPRSGMVLWLRDGATTHRVHRPYSPPFYVEDRGFGLDEARKILDGIAAVARVDLVDKVLEARSPAQRVLEVCVKETTRRLHAAHALYAATDYMGLGYWDVDVRIESAFLVDHGLFPLGACRRDAAGLAMLEDGWSLDWDLDLRVAPLRFDLPSGVRHRFPGTPIGAIRIGDEAIPAEGREEDALREASALVERLDPDVLLTDGGDARELPWWTERVKHHGLEGCVQLGRAPDPAAPVSTGGVFQSYNRDIYREAKWILHGRLHLDLAQTYIEDATRLDAIIHQSRQAALPPQVANRVGGGTVISQLTANERRRRGLPYRWHKDIPPRPATYRQMAHRDKGALILTPKPGVVYDVHNLDWISAYGFVIINWNLGKEALGVETPNSVWVPDLDLVVDVDEPAILPSLMKRLVDARVRIKLQLKDLPDCPQKRRLIAVYGKYKEVVVTAYGREGFKNHRHGSPEVHLGIQAVARHLARRAKTHAEAQGWVVHQAIVDSLMVHRPGATTGDAVELGRQVSEVSGIPMNYEGHFQALLSYPTERGASAPNRYVALAEAGGEHKIKGLEYAQHSTSPFFRAVQRAMVDALAEGLPGRRVEANLARSLDVALAAAKRIKAHDIDARELVGAMVVSRRGDEYRADTHQAAAVRLAEQQGLDRQAGQKLRFLVMDAEARRVENRVILAHDVGAGTPYDSAFYAGRLATMAWHTVQFAPVARVDAQRHVLGGRRLRPAHRVHRLERWTAA